ncbi:hypothetical protein B0H10DRAFT_2233574 [Mycena sp. CBHHK59/15]|nr:hypothetical protein B0H10DRAFT_2233574 [Mycena sp. CBHHK59/15]
MVNFAPAFLAAFAATLAATNALAATGLHKDGYVYGLDPDWTVAYDRNLTELARYYTPGNLAGMSRVDAAPAALGGKCTALTVNELTNLPGWPAVAQDIVRLWGGTSYNLWTTWDGVTRTQTCVGDGIVSLVPTGNRQCTLNNVTTSGILVNAAGSVAITITSGLSATAGETVTKESTLGASYTASVTVGVPDLISATASFTASVSFTNTYGTSQQSSAKTVTLNAAPGSQCELTLTDETCHQSSTGTVPFTATGDFRIGFNSRVNGHYYWSYGLDGFLPVDERSSYAQFTGSINSYSKGKYKGVCT